jgi:hypothetical protein
MIPRPLTHDERKAAEAAFSGKPCDPKWSVAARAVYDGLVKALPVSSALGQPPTGDSGSPPEATPATFDTTAPTTTDERSDAAAKGATRTRADALEKGLIIDVSPVAHSLGLQLPVAFSRPLWEAGISVSDSLPDDQQQARVRDVLLALTLNLVRRRSIPSVLLFPALLTFPPEDRPTIWTLYAVAHEDPDAGAALTLLLPNEVPTSGLLGSNN